MLSGRRLLIAALALILVVAAACGGGGSEPAADATATVQPQLDPPPAAAVREAVDAYGSAWGERDDGARAAILDTAWADGGIYTDPSAYVIGRDALVEHIGEFQAATDGGADPGGGLTATSAVETHYGALRFTWAILAPDGSEVLEGMDFGTIGHDARLTRISGFFGALTEPVPEDVPGNVETLLAAVNATSEGERKALLEQVWTQTSIYTTATSSVTGVDATAVAFAARAANRPGQEFVLTSYVDKHHDVVRFTWAWIDAGGAAIGGGISYLEVANDGSFTRLYEFIGERPPLDTS